MISSVTDLAKLQAIPLLPVRMKRERVELKDNAGRVLFEGNYIFPEEWSERAKMIMARMYMAKGVDYQEDSAEQVFRRIAHTIMMWGKLHEYPIEHLEENLMTCMLHQLAMFNSPVLFNIGRPDRVQQSSACFLVDVEDSMESILDMFRLEGMIFKNGSGSGINISKLRGRGESLSGGGSSSGPLAFVRAWDTAAGAIKSGGGTRRAAKMVWMDIDHPDVEEFIESKAVEERKAKDLLRSGWSGGMEGQAYGTVAFQNQNNSVMLTDAFMQAVEADESWTLRYRVN